ncbi:Wadjet anti-phage system protein JetD domain-containing protein [Turicibacter sanguinis]|uniref:Wadjet anti-phage system protein JetD domain-containing protein n=1 Tax=Turicibacter sanguinis TaxID=154288 RepID=UPI0021D49CFC|nr:Wadjet anti-phage system protein JetD domain-containing protein [Turicibacter sanguinis]MCU7192173.1 DUF2220 family protein [Turicibacter sanguinis]
MNPLNLTKNEKIKINQQIRHFKQTYSEGKKLTNRFSERLLQLLYSTLEHQNIQDLEIEDYVRWLNTWEQLGLLTGIKKLGVRRTLGGLIYYHEYKLKEFEIESDYDIELIFDSLHPRLKTGLSYYLKNPLDFDADYPLIQVLNQRLIECEESLSIPYTMNQRSFQLFQNEKLLSGKQSSKWSKEDEHWLKVIKRLDLTLEADSLNYVELKQLPQSIEINRKEEAGIVLILENQDPAITLLNLLIEEYPSNQAPLDGLIFGSGKTMESMFYYIYKQYFKGVLGHPNSVFYYAGDLDVEGLNIFKRLQAKYPTFNIQYLPHYIPYLVQTGAENWRLNTQRKLTEEEKAVWMNESVLGSQFEFILQQLEERKMIPQEVMTRQDWKILLTYLQERGDLTTWL